MNETLKTINTQEEIIKILQYAYRQGVERENISMLELVNEMKERLQTIIK